MIGAARAELRPNGAGWFKIVASAAFAIPRLGTGNATAASVSSGQRAFCGIMQASTSKAAHPSHWRRRKSPDESWRLTVRLAPAG